MSGMHHWWLPLATPVRAKLLRWRDNLARRQIFSRDALPDRVEQRHWLGVSSFSGPPPESGWLLPIDKLADAMLPLHQFKSQPRMHFKGTNFSCEEIIKYTANKLGGVHIDFRRKELSELYLVLEPRGSEILSGAHREVIAAAASLIQVHLNGQPVMDVRIKKSFWSRFRRLFLGTRIPALFDQGKQLKPGKRDITKE
jgi:hypothetical protein